MIWFFPRLGINLVLVKVLRQHHHLFVRSLVAKPPAQFDLFKLVGLIVDGEAGKPGVFLFDPGNFIFEFGDPFVYRNITPHRLPKRITGVEDSNEHKEPRNNLFEPFHNPIIPLRMIKTVSWREVPAEGGLLAPQEGSEVTAPAPDELPGRRDPPKGWAGATKQLIEGVPTCRDRVHIRGGTRAGITRLIYYQRPLRLVGGFGPGSLGFSFESQSSP